MLTSHVTPQNITNIYQLSRSGQVRVPVAPDAAIFSNFSHISGVVANGDSTVGQVTLSVSQLHMINQMVQRLYTKQEQQGQAAQELQAKLAEIQKSAASPEQMMVQLNALENELFSNNEVRTGDSHRIQAEIKQNKDADVLHDEGSLFTLVV